MFLNYGAGLHGHEFSGPLNSRNNNFTLRRTPLIRSSLVSSNSISQKDKINEPPTADELKPIRPLSEQLSRAVETTVRFQEPAHDFDSDMTSEGEGSIVNSDSNKAPSIKKPLRRKRGPRKSLVFHLAHPAPTLSYTQRLLQIHPKILLQLQLLSEQTRPKPFIDVISSPVLIPRLARKIPRLLRGKAELGSNDVIVLKSEDYDNSIDTTIDNSDAGEHGLANRDLLAVICQLPNVRGASQGVAEIVFSDGSICVATPLPGGLYECRIREIDGHEIIARWWIKKYPKRESIKTLEYADVNADLKYAFSIIDPNCKRHPVLATITHKQLEIFDSYTTLSSSSGKYPPTITFRDGLKIMSEECDLNVPERTTRKIDQKMQTLIQVTGIWVLLRQNWCPYFRYNDALAIACSSTRLQPDGRFRSSSLTLETKNSQSATHSPSTPDSLPGSTAATSIANVIRRVSLKGRSANCRSSRPETPMRPERAMSVGTAYIQRATARRASTCAATTVSRANEYENTKGIPPSVAIERCSTNTSNKSLTIPFGPNSSDLPANVTNQMSKVQTLTPSAYHPSTLEYGDFFNVNHTRNSSDMTRTSDFVSNSRPRIGRWKVITNFFRRLNNVSPRPEHSR